MKPLAWLATSTRARRVGWSAVIILTCAALSTGAWQLSRAIDAWDEQQGEPVDGVIWSELDSPMCANGWNIADVDDLERDEAGDWYYPVDVHTDRRYPGEPLTSGPTSPPTTAYLTGGKWRDYGVGDRYTGRLEPYMCDPPNNLSGMLIFIFVFIIPMICVFKLWVLWRGKEL
jgi:hypothetical protein